MWSLSRVRGGYSLWGYKESDVTEQVMHKQIHIPSAIQTSLGLHCSSVGKESAYSTGDPGSISGSGRCSGGEHGHPLQYSCLENIMDRRAWRAPIHGVAELYTT